MTDESNSGKEAVERVRRLETLAEEARIDDFREAGAVNSLVRSLLSHEALRLKQRDASDKRINELEATSSHLALTNLRMGALEEQFQAERELKKAGMVPENGIVILGRLVGAADGRGVSGLRMSLVDENDVPYAGVPETRTGSGGVWAISLQASEFKEIFEKQTRLAVFSSRGELVHREIKPLDLEAGSKRRIDVQLDRKVSLQTIE